MSPLMRSVMNRKIHRDRNQLVVPEMRVGENREWLLMEYKVGMFLCDENV